MLFISASSNTYFFFALLCLSSVAIATFPGRPPLSSCNSPFRILELADPRNHDENQDPICCLVPLPPVPDEPIRPKEDDEELMLLSFEEWKLKMFKSQQEKDKSSDSPPLDESRSNADRGGGGSNVSQPGVGIREEPEGTASITFDPSIPNSQPSNNNDVRPSQPASEAPHFRVPITDRFNYASTDCSARVHGSHKSAKSASSILSSKKDRYMLSPCNTKASNEVQHVIVELCDDIRIDTVQLANFEFFSGVFKDFEVSVAKTYTTDPSGWTSVGVYRAKNVRSVQSFHPPPTFMDFYRYMRIDFLSHYGSEYYCPVSLLRVYGLTHLELWKWEKWEEEFQERQAQKQFAVEQQQQQASAGQDSNVLSLASPTKVPADIPSSTDNPSLPFNDDANSSDMAPPPPYSKDPVISESSSVRTVDPGMQVVSTASENGNSASEPSAGGDASSSTSSTSLPSSALSTSLNTPSPPSSAGGPAPSPPSDTSIQSHHNHPVKVNSTGSVSSASSSPPPSTHIITTTTTSNSISTYLSNTGGESIYKLIMTRLSFLEANQTRYREINDEYRRYFEDQMAGVRSALKRLGEESGRMESLTKSQAALLSRAMADWERQRGKMESDYSELLQKVDWLSAQITLEKRLGIAQLCLLVTVLVFLGLTRGGVSQPVPLGFIASSSQHFRSSSSFGVGDRLQGIKKSFSWGWSGGGGGANRSGSPSAPDGDSVVQGEIQESKPGNDIAFPTKSSSLQPPSLPPPRTTPAPQTPRNPQRLISHKSPLSTGRPSYYHYPHAYYSATPQHMNSSSSSALRMGTSGRKTRSRTSSLQNNSSSARKRSTTPLTPRRVPPPHPPPHVRGPQQNHRPDSNLEPSPKSLSEGGTVFESDDDDELDSSHFPYFEEQTLAEVVVPEQDEHLGRRTVSSSSSSSLPQLGGRESSSSASASGPVGFGRRSSSTSSGRKKGGGRMNAHLHAVSPRQQQQLQQQQSGQGKGKGTIPSMTGAMMVVEINGDVESSPLANRRRKRNINSSNSPKTTTTRITADDKDSSDVVIMDLVDDSVSSVFRRRGVIEDEDGDGDLWVTDSVGGEMSE